MPQTVYQEHGFKNRTEYLQSIAEEYGVSEKTVFELAYLLGPSEDFDALITEIEDHF